VATLEGKILLEGISDKVRDTDIRKNTNLKTGWQICCKIRTFKGMNSTGFEKYYFA
jgi:hypothetical protein